MTTHPSLDPRKSPWKRGDVCTKGFERNGFVLNHTPEYLEVRWSQLGRPSLIAPCADPYGRVYAYGSYEG
jgi:hypothetical protein